MDTNMNIDQFEGRKRDHIRHALHAKHQAVGMGGLEKIHLHHEALPDLNFNEIDLKTPCLGLSLPTPFFIAGMTAGHSDATLINERLARACSQKGWALGLGSLRRELETDSSQLRDDWKTFRDKNSALILFANLGVTQLISASLLNIQRLVEDLMAQALVIHTNPLQECLQNEGTPQFRGALSKLKTLCSELKTPIVLKETGCGFSEETLKRLRDIGISAIDTSGLGGTHWGRIEGSRTQEINPLDPKSEAANTFAHWGESTLQSLIGAKKHLPGVEIWASGGVRSGLDAAKLIALGAERVGYAQPALQAALKSEETLHSWMERQEFELKVALFCTGSQTPSQLKNKEGAWTIQEN